MLFQSERGLSILFLSFLFSRFPYNEHNLTSCSSMSLDRFDLDVVVMVFASIPKTMAAYSTQSLLEFVMSRVFFFTGPPSKKLKNGKPRLGEVLCI